MTIHYFDLFDNAVITEKVIFRAIQTHFCLQQRYLGLLLVI